MVADGIIEDKDDLESISSAGKEDDEDLENDKR
jgi:hypothetical protein